MHTYPNLLYGPEELQATMREHYAKLIAFVTTPAFRNIVDELFALNSTSRPAYVQRVLLNEDELRKRGIEVPEGVLVQRSAFGDRRPTLFVVKHFLPEKYRNVWENVNITFDNEYEDSAVSREKELCWREPLVPHRQALELAVVT